MSSEDYKRMYTTRFSLRFVNEADADVLNRIKKQPKLVDYIRVLVRKDIEENPDTEEEDAAE